MFSNGKVLTSGSIDGKGGSDISLDFSAYTTWAVNVTLTALGGTGWLPTAPLRSGTNSITGSFSNINTITDGSNGAGGTLT